MKPCVVEIVLLFFTAAATSACHRAPSAWWVAYAANRGKSLSDIYLPALEDEQGAAIGFVGPEAIAVVETSVVRRFAIKGGKTLQLRYRLQAGQAFRWQPAKSPAGPVSVLISRHDARILLMRNGIEIGRARIQVADPSRPLGNHVFVAQEGYLDKAHVGASDLRLHRWAAMPLEGSQAGGGATAYADIIRRVRIPAPFLREAYALFEPGTTMVITDAPVLESTNNVPLTVFSTREPDR